MTSGKKYQVFVSYSREDLDYLSPIFNLIKTIKKDHVFHDIASIEFAKPWESQIFDALDQSKLVIVFWCVHSANSDFVRKEYLYAIEKKKDILPVFLDNTEVPIELSKYQGIDFKYFHTLTQVAAVKKRKKLKLSKPESGLTKTVYLEMAQTIIRRLDKFIYCGKS